MKLVHVSDIHINPTPILQEDPVVNFQLCMDHIDKHHSDADLVVITGDLTHHGEKGSYEKLRQMLDGWSVKPLLMIGNHDDRDKFQEVFPEVPKDENGFVQFVHKADIGHFICLDTYQPGTHAGYLCADRQEWLRQRLSEAQEEGASVFIMMHHNPIPVGVPNADLIGLVHGQEFRTIIKEYKPIIRHVFFGHCHYTLSGSVCGVPISAPRSNNHPCIQDFHDAKRMGYGPFPPTYNLCLIGAESEIVHTIEFTQDDNISWLVLAADGWIDEEV